MQYRIEATNVILDSQNTEFVIERESKQNQSSLQNHSENSVLDCQNAEFNIESQQIHGPALGWLGEDGLGRWNSYGEGIRACLQVLCACRCRKLGC